MATFTLTELSGRTLHLGPITLSNFRDDGSNLHPNNIVIETIEGAEPGLRFRGDVLGVLVNRSPLIVGVDFQVNAASSILEGASMSLDRFDFGAPDAGGRVTATLSEQRSAPNIGIDLVLDNAPGGIDVPTSAEPIDGGPVQRFRFEYDLSIVPVNEVPVSFGATTILFDLIGDDTGLPPGFDGLQYIASYADLIAAFGADRSAGEQHFLGNGQAESRRADLFGETQYLTNHGDLQAAFGSDVNAATAHFITNGLAENRTDDAPSPAQIDGLQYIASNEDLIAAFGANAAAGQQHYVSNGQAEGRALDTFNETQYLANYTDLQAAFGTNTEAATQHYIQFGFAENRNDFLL